MAKKSKKQDRNLLGWAILISLGVHTLFFLAHLLPHSQPPENIADNNEPIEISPAPPQNAAPPTQATQPAPPKPKIKSKEIEMAETEDSGKHEIDPNAKFLSDRNQTADKQTRAKSVDDFREKKGTGLKSEDHTKDAKNYIPATGSPEEKEPEAANDLEVATGEGIAKKKDKGQGVKRDWKTLSLKDLSVNGDGGTTAASDDALRGVQEGDRTVLSTREYRYFSYYQRIKELLRQFWKPTVEKKMYLLYEKGKSFGDDELVTKLLVLLNPTGNIVKISRVTSSGVNDLDDAAIEAFNKAGPFPNPPKGIIDADGFVRINWEFILKTEAAPTIQFTGAGAGY